MATVWEVAVAASSYKAVLAAHSSAPAQVRDYFERLPWLVQNREWEIALAYMFIRLERAHNMTLYCGVVKVHRANCTMARSVINVHHLTREGFVELFANVIGKPMPPGLDKRIKEAEKTRDRVVHGKQVTAAEIRDAIVDILEYAADLNLHVSSEAGFMPFSDLRGFKGRASSLDSRTTRWLLRGLGFGVS
jgi:hypothetical protein